MTNDDQDPKQAAREWWIGDNGDSEFPCHVYNYKPNLTIYKNWRVAVPADEYDRLAGELADATKWQHQNFDTAKVAVEGIVKLEAILKETKAERDALKAELATVKAESFGSIRKQRDEALAERDEYKRKGEELCSAYGLKLMDINEMLKENTKLRVMRHNLKLYLGDKVWALLFGQEK